MSSHLKRSIHMIMVQSRMQHWWLIVQNCWVVYESIDPEAQEAEAMLRVWDSCQKRKGHLTLGSGKGV